ncbi:MULTISPECIES: DUF1616 domain-containing protein [Halorussus]|uniref:DUF1616 domain-containing protein n=1 Tax=Halorussus TaxID=1070314 RepID=UPI0020A192A3|nr:DUF1616 domain-containing protein [Halorussus vallis]USZ78218.1 DUF1616 domain-containing protein [Halorussus vallis]
MKSTRFRPLLVATASRIPSDLVGVLSLVVLTNVVVFVPESPGRLLPLVVGLPFTLFAPGYAVVAALFPRRGDVRLSRPTRRTDREPPAGRGRRAEAACVDRVALSVGLSFALVPLVVLASKYAGFEVALRPIVASLSGFTLLATAGATYRRLALDPAERFRLPLRAWFETVRAGVRTPDTAADFAATLLVVVGVVALVATVSYVGAFSPTGQSFTEFYVLDGNDTDELAADGSLAGGGDGERRTLRIGIANHERSRETYTVIVQRQRVSVTDDGVVPRTTRTLGRYRTTVEPGASSVRAYDVPQAEVNGSGRVRLRLLLYRGAPPSKVSGETAYRALTLWAADSNASAAGRPATETVGE